jgi:hypothetical protein
MKMEKALPNYPSSDLAKNFGHLASNDARNYTEGYTEANETTKERILKRAGINDPDRFVVCKKPPRNLE